MTNTTPTAERRDLQPSPAFFDLGWPDVTARRAQATVVLVHHQWRAAAHLRGHLGELLGHRALGCADHTDLLNVMCGCPDCAPKGCLDAE
jgi:hypothetical protein